MNAATIAQTKLKPRLRALALQLLDCADNEGYVAMSERDMYIAISGAEPTASGFVQVDLVVVGKAIMALHKAGTLAASCYNPPFQADVVMRLNVPVGAEEGAGL